MREEIGLDCFMTAIFKFGDKVKYCRDLYEYGYDPDQNPIWERYKTIGTVIDANLYENPSDLWVKVGWGDYYENSYQPETLELVYDTDIKK